MGEMEMGEQLKLISLTIGSSDTKKNLEDGNFHFYNEGKHIPINFFKAFPKSYLKKPTNASQAGRCPEISVSAIIGKNGSGKSALIEELIRIINNFAYNRIKSPNADLNLAGRNINHTLHFKIGERDYYLNHNSSQNIETSSYYDDSLGKVDVKKTMEQSSTKLYENSIDETNDETNRIDNKLDTKTLFSSHFFYTILVNYSIYAFNTRDNAAEYEEENEGENNHWLKGVFHKNDGYQTPIVLNPMRTEGNFDINKEASLAKDRLISLFLDGSIENVNEKNILDSLIIAPPFKWEPLEEKIKNKWGEEKISVFKANISGIKKAWLKKYKFHPEHESSFKGTNWSVPLAPLELAIEYLAYKTLTIAWRYGKDILRDKEIEESIFTASGVIPEEDLDHLIEILDKDTSHITTKLRQVLSFLILNHYPVDTIPYGSTPPKYRKNEYEKYKEEMSIWKDWTDSKNLSEYKHISKDNLNRERINEAKQQYGWKSIDFCPAHCFNTEILLKRESSNDDIYKITQISSGERQQIYSISTILYHLRNLNSISDDGRISYKHVNLILDEIELYFHPEYQRTFIYELLSSICRAGLDRIESINIMMATHSPFILSDIPKDNVLFLQDGKPCEVDAETFGANIHTLYRNSFFMEGAPMGEFAKNKIKSLFERVKAKDMKENDALLNEIKLVEEPIIRSQLLRLYKENTSHDFCNKEKRIEELEKKYNS